MWCLYSVPTEIYIYSPPLPPPPPSSSYSQIGCHRPRVMCDSFRTETEFKFMYVLQ